MMLSLTHGFRKPVPHPDVCSTPSYTEHKVQSAVSPNPMMARQRLLLFQQLPSKNETLQIFLNALVVLNQQFQLCGRKARSDVIRQQLRRQSLDEDANHRRHVASLDMTTYTQMQLMIILLRHTIRHERTTVVHRLALIEERLVVSWDPFSRLEDALQLLHTNEPVGVEIVQGKAAELDGDGKDGRRVNALFSRRSSTTR